MRFCNQFPAVNNHRPNRNFTLLSRRHLFQCPERMAAAKGAKLIEAPQGGHTARRSFVDDAPLDRTDAFFEGTPAEISTTIRSASSGDADILAFSVGARF